MDRKAKPITVTVQEHLCKGCEICVKVCPTKVLAMRVEERVISRRMVAVVNLNACTRCFLCEVFCPDFSLTIH